MEQLELIKLLWIVVFFLFSLTLLFVWSKLYIISKKAQALVTLLGEIESLEEKDTGLKKSGIPEKQPAL
jgi:hypothetical protein